MLFQAINQLGDFRFAHVFKPILHFSRAFFHRRAKVFVLGVHKLGGIPSLIEEGESVINLFFGGFHDSVFLRFFC